MSILDVRRTRDILVESGVADTDKALELAVALDEELTNGAVPRAGVEAQLAVLDAKMDAQQARLDAHQARTDAKLADMDAENERRMNRLQLFILGTGAVIIGVIGILLAIL